MANKTTSVEVGPATLWCGDSLDVIQEYEPGHFTLLLTSTPYPGQRGFNVSVDEYWAWWTVRFHPMILRMSQAHGVIVQNIMFKRTDDGWWDTRIFLLPKMFEQLGLHCQNIYIWDKLNAPPSGDHDRYDRSEWEFCFVFARSPYYKHYPQRVPYSAKTVGKARAGNMRKADVAGSHAGGHAELHPDGARQGNVLRISSSGDQGRPRVKGGVFPRHLADRFILTFTDPGDVVLDPCMGSGTTVVQAIEHDRKAVGIDIDPAAFQTATAWVTETVARRKLPLFDR